MSSYLLILLIPLIFLAIVIYENAAVSLKTQIEKNSLNQLNQTKFIIDSRFKELNEITARISYDTRLSPYRVHDEYYVKEAIEALDQFKASSSIISEIFLYIHNDKRIYSASGSYDFKVFTDNFRFENWLPSDAYHDLNNVKVATIYPADVVHRNTIKEKYLSLLVPIKPNHPNPHGSVLYLIKETEMTKLIDSVFDDFHGVTMIIDNEGNVLTSSDNTALVSSLDIPSLLNLPPTILEQDINEQTHSLISVKSELSGWTYLSVIPNDQFLSSVLQVRSVVVMLVTILLIAGITASLFFARLMYRPISTLVEYANQKTNKTSKTDSLKTVGNELERIRSALQTYSSRIDLQEPYARNHFLTLLLQQGKSDLLTTEIMDAIELHFDTFSSHFVVVLDWNETSDGQDGNEERLLMANKLSKIFFPNLSARGYGVELPQLDRGALIISFNPNKEQHLTEHIKLIVEAIRDNVLDMADLSPIIGVGNCYTDIEQLNQSFIEACSALELRTGLHEQGAIIYFDQISHAHDHTYWVSDIVLLKLAQSLKQGNYDVAAQMVHASMETLHRPELSTLIKRSIAFDIQNTILKTAAELKIVPNIQDIVPNTVTNSAITELEKGLFNLISHICTTMVQEQLQENESLIDQMVDYINNRYTDHMLSLDMIALEFSISPSYVSRLFKEKLGVNFTQYIWQKRLEEVKRQLITTEDPLKEIIFRVGYLDTPNFIRKFKKETNYTPGQYRKIFAEKEIEDDYVTSEVKHKSS